MPRTATEPRRAPPASPGTLGAATWLTVAEQLRRLRGYRSAVLAGRDPEDLHQLRVALRRLRAALELGHEALDLPAEASADRLKTLTRAMGRLRDLDVALELTEPLVPVAKGDEGPALDRIRSELSRRRRATTKAVRRTLRSPTLVATLKALRQWVRSPEFHPAGFRSLHQATAGALADAEAELRANPLWSQPRPNRRLSARDSEALHALRKEARRLRYLLEILARSRGETVQPALDHLHRVQDALGALQDLATAERIIELIDPEATAAAARLIRRRMSRQRAETLATWEALRLLGYSGTVSTAVAEA
ncbi:MAG: CHAD domain-containing protein [Gemmatimonadales bacterium]